MTEVRYSLDTRENESHARTTAINKMQRAKKGGKKNTEKGVFIPWRGTQKSR